jgi:DNA polymerase
MMLNQMLKSIGVSRRETFITNVVKFRPPGNRTPTPGEIIHAIDTLRAEWSIIQPVLTIAVGAPAQLALNQRGMPHGMVRPFGRRDGHWVASVYHPAFGLRKKQARVWIENEWELLGKEIGEIGLEIQ